MGNKEQKSASGAKPAREQLWSPTFIVIVALTLCCFMVGQGLNSSVSVYVAGYGGSATYAGVLAAVFSAAAAAARLVAGPLIDERGRRVVILGGCALLIVGTIGPVFSHEAAPFVVFRALQGAGFSAATTASGTAAADVLPSSRLGEGIGYYGLGQALAMSVGPAFALFLVSMDPAENLFFGLCAIATCALLLTLSLRYEKNPQILPASCSWAKRFAQNDAREAGSQTETEEASATEAAQAAEASPAKRESLVSRIFEPRALCGTFPMLLVAPAFGFTIFFGGLYGSSLGVGNAGIFFTVSALAMVVVRLKSGAFMDKVAPLKVFGAAVICGIAAFALLLASGSVLSGTARDIVFYLAGIPYGICIGIALPLNQSIAVKNTPPERWGAANALFQLANDAGIGAGCIIWGIVNDKLGFAVTLVCVLCCVAASFFVAKASYPKQN